MADSPIKGMRMSKLLYNIVPLVGLLVGTLSFTSSAATIAGNCNPVKVNTCALPFPSDLFTESNPQSPTGKRVVIPSSTFELFANETPSNPVPYGPSLRPEALFLNSSGFSAAAPVMFEVSEEVDEASLPADGGNVLQVYEIGGSGQPVPVNVAVMKAAKTSRVARKDVVIEAWPRSRWKYGAQYVAVLTQQLKTETGGSFEPVAEITSILNETNTALAVAHSPALNTLIPLLNQQGMTADDILSLTFFTVRDEAEVVQPIAKLAQKIYSQDHEIRGWKVEHHAFKYKAVTVEGEIKLTNYRDAKGDIILDDSYPGDENWVAFRLTIPQSAGEKPAPLVLYGHGITADKETMTAVDQLNAIRGIATLAIDQPNHGTRKEADGGYIMDILVPDELGKVIGMISQSALDMVATSAAVLQHLQTLNTLPHNHDDALFPWLGLQGTDDIPDLDLTHLYYEGTSMGGVLGSTYLGLAPRLDGAFLHVSGVGITYILTHSALWSRFQKLAPEAAMGSEVAAYIGMVQQKIDYGDGINFIHHVRQGSNLLPYTYHPFPLGLVYVDTDGVVVNNSSLALSEIADLPLAPPDSHSIQTVYEQLPLAHTPTNQWLDDDGYGVRLVQPYNLPVGGNNLFGRLFNGVITSTNSLMAHLSFGSDGGEEFQKAWTDTVILKQQDALMIETSETE